MINIHYETLASREYYEYKNTSDFIATWGVYDKYSGNYMYSTTTSQKGVFNISWKRVKQSKLRSHLPRKKLFQLVF
ncbi:hypothetical protein HMI01_28270 [Halolactibacillus miurensis]|uniref:Uncharacterized protein n=1 Tax=Halolactibacillus miurensis TaxID=306541 RepID=A0ABQ0W1M9_9BACI|nr:hypothetical protein HMI01_28270 [Halolactibacillus miurensis]